MAKKSFRESFWEMPVNQQSKAIVRHLKYKCRTKNVSHALSGLSKVDLPVPNEFIRLDPNEMEYLFMVGKAAKRGIVEIGRLNGGSTLCLAFANTKTPIYSIDINPRDDNFLTELFENLGVGQNVNLITGSSHDTTIINSISDVDMLFVDGDHSYEGCLNDLNLWWERLIPGGHIVCHDCYHGGDPQNAIIDFLIGKNVIMHKSPFIAIKHWISNEAGSISHFQKPY